MAKVTRCRSDLRLVDDLKMIRSQGAKSDEEATYEEDQGNEAVEDTNTDLDGRDEVMTDVIFSRFKFVNWSDLP
ncbi:hypothetical protein Tco_0977039 [Tanacetum coccineum]|uniref:Uncharacterized protein n=1 Tax=Tanacetum coccineum TaxID=301880 RepID=A0ABQ5EJ81_9ASTR